MGWPKGKPRGRGPKAGNAGMGRKKGAVNKISKPFVLRMQACLDEKTDKEIQDWFDKNMTEAMRIMASLERKEIKVSGGISHTHKLSEHLEGKLIEVYKSTAGA